MRRVTLCGVPVHPALFHFPVAFWILVPLLNLWPSASRMVPKRRMGDGTRIRKSWAHENASLSSKYPAMHQSPGQPLASFRYLVHLRRLAGEDA
jgi:hypothetical protein